MKRREFSLSTVALALAGSSALSPAQAQLTKPREGKEYLVLSQRVPTDTAAGQVEVIEFFWYSCPHCNAFEPTFSAWVKTVPKDVTVRRVPVAFRDDFAPQQRLFYTLEAMGKVEELHGKVFNAIHRERQDLRSDEAIAAWVEKQGLDKAKYGEISRSFAIASKVRRAVQLQNAFGVEGVPSLGIAGRWYTDGTLAGSMERALQVTEHLIGEARKSR